MNRCPITYDFCGESRYSRKGLKLLSPKLNQLAQLDFSAEELRSEAFVRASGMSVQGVQPKLSAVLNVKEGRFEIVSKDGRFILKPQHHLFPELPQNEDLTMHMAAATGIQTPMHGLVYSKDDSLTYFIKRFDRVGKKDKLPVEDFAQLAGLNRETKYNYSMERLVKLIDDYCTFPVLQKAELFRRVLFNFLIGNEDMHLKNYSVIIFEGKVELTPAYDLLNSSIVLKGSIEEIALPIKGKKKDLTQNMLFNYFGKERCSLNEKTIQKIVECIDHAIPAWFELIEKSFLSTWMKEKYIALLNQRMKVLGLV